MRRAGLVVSLCVVVSCAFLAGSAGAKVKGSKVKGPKVKGFNKTLSTVIYVDTGAGAGANDGTSWVDAYVDLQDGLAGAAGGDEIWVAAGTYKPGTARTDSFRMKNGVGIYGGFAATGEPGWGDRDPNQHETILSGDLLDNDNPATAVAELLDDPCRADNCYHVFYHPDGTDLNVTAVLDGFTITGGNADGSGDHDDGGGMYNYSSSPTLTGSTFSDNSAYNNGGGMYNYTSSPTVTGCTFSGNEADFGGGMYNYDYSNPTVTNCTFSGNWAWAGGGMYIDGDCMVTAANCTFSGNTAVNGRGLAFDSTDHSNPSAYEMINCIFWDGGHEIWNIDGSIITINYSDVQGEGGWGGVGNLDVDPLFVDADGADDTYGTEDDNLRLQTGSLCIDGGGNNGVTVATDLDGQPRIMDSDGNGTAIVDMGVYEKTGTVYEPTVIYVNRAAGGGGNNGLSWADAFTSLQDGLDGAVIGDDIWVAAGTYYPSTKVGGTENRHKTFQMRNHVGIYGGFPDSGDPNFADRDSGIYITIASGDLYYNDNPATPVEELLDDSSRGENCYHVFYHPDGTDLNATAVLDGFTITGGNADGSGDHANGGGMYNGQSSPTLTGCTFSRNSAHDNGGGMLNDFNSNPTVTNCTFSGNSVERRGGGMYNGQSSPTVTGCTFSGNSAGTDDSHGLGGGMYNYTSSPTVTGCAFTGNTVSWGGGGMENTLGSSPSVTDCTFAGNSADWGGGMSNWDNSSPTVTGCTFSGNWANGGTYNQGGGMLNEWNSNPIVTNCIFSGNEAGSDGGGMSIYRDCVVTVANCTFAGNSAVNGNGLACDSFDQSPSAVQMTNCIFWDGGNEIWNNDGSTITITYSDVKGGWPGVGNINGDPLFAELGYWDTNDTPNDPNDDFWMESDYHLKSQAGRWDPVGESWVYDGVTSPCIDTGDPADDVSDEPCPNGGVINMGAFGGTAQASKSEFGPVGPEIVTGEIGVYHGGTVGDVWCIMEDGYIEARVAGISKLRLCFDRTMDTTLIEPSFTVAGEINGLLEPGFAVIWEDDYCMILEFDAPLPDQDTYTLTMGTDVLSAPGCPLSGDRDVCVTALAGDANGNGTVNAQDMLAVRAHNGEPVDGDNAWYDVNCNGVINAQDMLAVRARNGDSAPGCP